ncbi:methylenetetrahydrofolate reductase [Marinobacter orientalis]|uniref:Methylenetetrahydrofolate reductase n=1 Tax=Marinobacter orientalis TaxID=1928859 RepID=A0A7Y0RDK0_9GAMM|nr:methylenetetrahydrofolate reductase [Marinobacter orientalis]NMT64267.1 methylenetetrahydrofolate reductase [Marinobacter orientalis]TGX49486.1 methylenetetrahydrofolate reductase [Marinobacter orientalis]
MKLVSEKQAANPRGKEAAARLRALVRSASIEATPRQILTTEHLTDLLPAGTCVYVPFLPKGRFSDTLDACRHLLSIGMQPVPHIPARMAESRGQLRDWLAQLDENRIDRLLLIAGDSDAVAGPFPDTLAVLESGLLAQFRFHGIGVAAHPDGHPMADRATLGQALSIKREYARTTSTRLWVVTQFTFDADVVIDWLQSLGDILEEVPVYIGMAGPTRVKTLIAYAAQCGVGASARTMLRRPGSARLLRAWTPDGMVRALVQYCLDNPETLLRGIHLFPFGGLRQSAQWIQEHSGSVEDQRGQLHEPSVQ